MIQGKASLYKAFLVVEYPMGTIRAYRSLFYLNSGISSYEVAESPGWFTISTIIDGSSDYGEFTDEQYLELTGRVPEATPHAALGGSYRMMYHTTPFRNWDKIRQEGLIPKGLEREVTEATGVKFGVYLEDDPDEAYGWAMSLSCWEVPEDWNGEVILTKFAILEVKIPSDAVFVIDPQVTEIGSERVPTSFITSEFIPPENIRLYDTTEAEIG